MTTTTEYGPAVESIKRLRQAGFGFEFDHDQNRSLNAGELEQFMDHARPETDAFYRCVYAQESIRPSVSPKLFYATAMQHSNLPQLYVSSRANEQGDTSTRIMPANFDLILGLGYHTSLERLKRETAFGDQPSLDSFAFSPLKGSFWFTLLDSSSDPQRKHAYLVLTRWQDESFFKENGVSLLFNGERILNANLDEIV